MRSTTIADNDKIHLSVALPKSPTVENLHVTAKAAAKAQTSSIFQGNHLAVSKTISISNLCDIGL